ncbi:MAG: hypothetical protein MJ086_04710 [Lachnospiraceae bacterium]|nr:hypothetical protein [Lachnospiraceae bacterium]
MKKKKLFTTLAVGLILVMALSLCACGGKEDPVDPASTPETTKAVETTTPAETTAPETDPAPVLPTEAEMGRATKELITAINDLNALSSGAIDIDDDVIYTSPEGYVYNLVTDPQFQNFGDISKFLDDYFTLDFAVENYPWLATPGQEEGIQQFLYIQEDSVPTGLYMVQAGKGFTVFDPNADLTFEDVTEGSFTAVFDFDNFGMTDTARMDIVKDNGLWKIDNIDK